MSLNPSQSPSGASGPTDAVAGTTASPVYESPALVVLGTVGQQTLGAGSQFSDGPNPGGHA